MRVVHGEQDFHFHRPIRPGDVIADARQAARLRGAAERDERPRSCSSAATTDGEVVNEQYMTAFFRGVDAGETVGELAPSHKFPRRSATHAPVAKVVAHVDDDQTFRYAPASGDPMPIHTRRRRSPGRPGCPGSSSTGCAPRRSRRGRC